MATVDTEAATPSHPAAEQEGHEDPDNRTCDPEILALSRSNSAGLVANFVLLLGYIFALWFQIYDFTDRARETIAVVVYFLAFICLITSGVIEFSIDVFSVRTSGHGRYHSDSAWWNRAISTLFITAGTLDIVAFIYWMRKDFDTEDTVLLASSYILLVMAILALGFHVQDILKETWQETITSDRIDLVANGLVLALTVMGVVLRRDLRDNDEAADRLELATMPMWLFSSMMYVTTDVIRVKTGIAIAHP